MEPITDHRSTLQVSPLSRFVGTRDPLKRNLVADPLTSHRSSLEVLLLPKVSPL